MGRFAIELQDYDEWLRRVCMEWLALHGLRAMPTVEPDPGIADGW